MAGAVHATKQEIDAFFKVAKTPKANQVSRIAQGYLICHHFVCATSDSAYQLAMLPDMLRLSGQSEYRPVCLPSPITFAGQSLNKLSASPLCVRPPAESNMEQRYVWRIYLPGLF